GLWTPVARTDVSATGAWTIGRLDGWPLAAVQQLSLPSAAFVSPYPSVTETTPAGRTLSLGPLGAAPLPVQPREADRSCRVAVPFRPEPGFLQCLDDLLSDPTHCFVTTSGRTVVDVQLAVVAGAEGHSDVVECVA